MTKTKIIGNKRVCAFIDASNLWEAQKTKGQLLDFVKLKTYLKSHFKTKSVKVYYYTAYPEEGTRDYSTSPMHGFYTFLSKGPKFIVRKKPLKRIHNIEDDHDSVIEKGNMDVEMTIDAVNTISKYDVAVLFTGDSDFMALVNFIKNKDKKVYVFSSRNNVSTEMRTGGDGYTDILEIDGDIWGKTLRYRNQSK
jgi:uncharacterized LabA/DUF88 family protein